MSIARPRVGIILTGGGARAAYQVGVLHALAAIRRECVAPAGNPFPVIAGTSAGAINAAALAGDADDFDPGIAFNDAEALADRVFARPVLRRQRLVDDRNRQRRLRVAVGEVAAARERQLHSPAYREWQDPDADIQRLTRSEESVVGRSYGALDERKPSESVRRKATIATSSFRALGRPRTSTRSS